MKTLCSLQNLLLLGCLTISSLSYAATITPTAKIDWASSNLNTVDQYAIPAYQKLYDSSQALQKSNDTFCATVNNDNFKQLQASFHQTMDAWQYAQTFRLGPAGQFMRSFRLEMWPDRSNAAAKHLRKLQKSANPDSLANKQFAKASVAVQGLSAMERLIYAKKISFTAFQDKEHKKANFKCHLSQAISLNVVTISKELLEAWQGDYREIIAKPSKDNDFFETDQEVASQFLNELNTQIQVIIDQKFNRPMDADKFRLTRAESWRSQRSLKNISINLQSTQQLYQIAFAPNIADKALIETQTALFDKAIKAGEALNIPLTTAYSDKKAELEAWLSAIKALKTSIATALPAAIGIQLGFNSLDGD